MSPSSLLHTNYSVSFWRADILDDCGREVVYQGGPWALGLGPIVWSKLRALKYGQLTKGIF